MLVNLKNILAKADREHYAVGGFNMTTLESALGIVEAAESQKSPVIIQITEKTIDYMGLDVAFAVSKTLADKAAVPVVIHFDHGRAWTLVEDAIKIGFSSVMLDVSKMLEAERIPFVKTFVKNAHQRGVTVEVEEDIIGGKEDYITGQHWRFTDPARAATFAKQTGCDAFAVSIGNSHGQPQPHETFDLKLLSEINKAVSCPLVLHGASSTPDHFIRDAISRGVRKINIDTDLRLAFTKELRATLAEDKDLYDPRDELRPTIGEIKDVVTEKIRLFGSNNKI